MVRLPGVKVGRTATVKVKAQEVALGAEVGESGSRVRIPGPQS